MVVCACDQDKVEGDGTHKVGFHVVWPEVVVQAATALALRQLMVDALDAQVDLASCGIVGGAWNTIVDASVYRANGLRMPWSAKGRADMRVYRPVATLEPTTRMRRVQQAGGVTALRDWIRRLSIRTQMPPTLALATATTDAATDVATGAPSMTSMSLTQYADVLPALAAALPIEFLGQRFTAIVQPNTSAGQSTTAHSFILRSTARYCMNLGRAHRTNTVYFVLTRRGVHQRCYCRCETTEGRKYGMCKDFASQVWPVPTDVLNAFFVVGDDDDDRTQQQTPPRMPRRLPTAVSSMPSRAARSSLSLHSLMARSRPPTGKHKSKHKSTTHKSKRT